MKRTITFCLMLCLSLHTLSQSAYAQCAGTTGGMSANDDFDGDGICNDSDIDDDNDGVPDENELNCATVSVDKAGIVVTKPATINYTVSGSLASLVNDVDVNNVAIYHPTGTLVNSEWFRIELPSAKVLTYWEVGHYSGQTLFSTTSTYKVQGSNDATSWVDLTGTLTYTDTKTGLSSQTNSNIAEFADNEVAYKYYRYLGSDIATAGNGWATEFYFKERACSEYDSDGDGIVNRFELDSDNDGCYDKYEAGVTGVTLNGSFSDSMTVPSGTAGDVGANGLSNSVETAADNGVVNYNSNYPLYAVSNAARACVDTDNDGVKDVADLDDDNDGILDKAECPEAFTNLAIGGGFTQNPPMSNFYLARPSSNYEVASRDLYGYGANDGQVNSPLTGGLFDEVDGNNANTGLLNVLLEDPSFSLVCRIDPKLLAGATYRYAFDIALRGYSNNTGTYVVELYDADRNIVAQTLNNTSLGTLHYFKANPNFQTVSGSFIVNTSSHYYLVFRTTGAANREHDILIDRIALQGNELACDTDGDGIPNHRDLDSDGDGCPDATEGGGGFTASNLQESNLPGGNSGAGYNGQVTFGVDDNLGTNVDANGVPVIANGGQSVGQSQIAGTPCTEIEPCVLEIGGTIYRDIDSAENGVNGTPIDGNAVACYVSLVSGGTVQAVTKVQSNGTYRFANVAPGGYQLVLCTNSAGTVSPSLPSGTKAIAEGGEIDPVSGHSKGDGTPNAMTDITVVCPGAAAYLHFDFGVDVTLPVTLISLSVDQVSEGNKLTWVTADEKDFDRFEIEYSGTPQNSFNKIGEVQGGGSHYSFVDAASQHGPSYYRLKMIDLDGTYKYSRIVTVTSRNGQELNKVYPNPSNGKSIRIASYGAIESAKVYDAGGREVVVQAIAESGVYEFSFAGNVKPGMYVIAYRTGGRMMSQQFVISF